MTDLVGHYGVVRMTGVLGQTISRVTDHWANHTFLVLPGGMVAEAWVPYVHIRPLSDYDGLQVLYNDHEKISKKQRQTIVEFAESAVGWHYDYLHFSLLALYHIFGLDSIAKLPRIPSASICSRLVVMAGAAAGLDWTGGLEVDRVTPADLARRIEHARLGRGSASLSVA